MTTSPAVPTILVTVTGPDRPGVAAAVVGALARPGVEVLDLEQVVVRGHLTLAVLVTSGPGGEAIVAAARAAGAALGMRVECVTGTRRQRAPPAGTAARHACSRHRCCPATVAAIAGRLADRGAQHRPDPAVVPRARHHGGVRRLRRRRRRCCGASSRSRPRRTAWTSPSPPPASPAAGGGSSCMDVDSTLIQDEVIELLAAHAGRAAEVAAVTERAMRGELDFAASLHERVGVPRRAARRRCWTTSAPRCASHPGPHALPHAARLGFTRRRGVRAGSSRSSPRWRAELDIQHVHANRLEVAGGRLTGRVVGEVVDRAGKAAALRRFAAAEGLPLARTVAIGDGANDLDMLAEAGLGIAFNAKPIVRAQADAAVTVPYLDAVLYLLGIPRAEIEEADALDLCLRPGPAERGAELGGDVGEDLHVVLVLEAERQRERDLVDLAEAGVRVEPLGDLARRCRRRSGANISRAGPCGEAVRGEPGVGVRLVLRALLRRWRSRSG